MKLHVISTLAIVATLAACATAPEQNSRLESARLVFAQAQNDPKVAQSAPVELARAEATLREAEQAWNDSPGDARVDHLAYLAEQRAVIARETAANRAAEQALQQAGAERERLLLAARTKEVQTARTQAAASQSEAEHARQEAQAAREQLVHQQREAESARQAATVEQAQQLATTERQRAERLQQQLNELQGQQTERGISVVLSGLLFESGKANLKQGAERRLEQVARILRENPAQMALVEGFTDSVGREDFNEELSERRAQAVRGVLIAQGIDAERIQARGYGEAYPVASNNTLAGRQQNRRVEIIVSPNGGAIPQRDLSGNRDRGGNAARE